MVVCQSKGIPALALVALETLLQLVEMETEAGLVHGAMLSATGLGRVVDRALTREFVKVCEGVELEEVGGGGGGRKR